METAEGTWIHQVLVKLLNGKHKTLNFTAAPSISTVTLKQKIEALTSIPCHLQLLVPSNSFYPLEDDQTLNLRNRDFPVVVNLLLRLRGGKGGFGSLLRGAATKAGQKKTNNFDACRDMSGRRLRHVNAEKKLEEWRAEAEERKLEKMAEEFIKKKSKEMAKKGNSKGVNGDNTDMYVHKYREDSAKCMEEVERTVRESLKGFLASKRKAVELNESDSKKLKIWLGKRMKGDSDSEDLDESDSDEEEEEEGNDKSEIIDNGNSSVSNGESEGSLGSVTGRKVDTGASDRNSEEEKDTTVLENPESGKDDVNEGQLEGESLQLAPNNQERIAQNSVASTSDTDFASVTESIPTEQEVSGTSEPVVIEASSGEKENVIPEAVPQEDAASKKSYLGKPLNLEEFSSAVELEVLGMERLKTELQARGLKCGGTLQERAARLFLLKTTSLEMLPKKLLAKK